MNEEALNEAYAVFKSGGYTDSIEDFKVLIATNTEALNEAYSVFKSGGYTDSIEDFKTLLGVTAPSKKKVPSEPVGMLRDTMVSTSRPIQAKDALSELQFDETKYSEPDVTIPLKREEPKKDLFGGTLLADSYVDEFEKSQKGITGKLIEDQEEYTVPKLNYEYGQYGFTFQESTVGADAMTVTADNGKAIEVNLDPWFGIGAESEAEALKKFLKENKSTSAISKTSKKIQNEKEILNTVKIFNAETQQFQLEVNKLISTKKELDDVYSNKFANISAADIKNNPTLKAEYDEWSRNQNALKNNVSKLKNKEELFKTKGAELDTVVGEYAIMKSQQGTWAGAVFNALIEGMKGVGVSSGNIVTDVLTEFSDNAGLPVEYFQSEIIRIAREDNIVPKEYQEPGKLESLSRDELVKALGGDTNDLAWMSNSFGKGLLMLTPMSMQSIAAIKGPFYEETPFDKARAKVLDLSRKSLKYYDSDERGTAYEKAVSGKMIQPYSYQAATVDTDKSMIERTADFYDDYLKNQSTTKQYSDMKKENFWGGALLGLAESLPAMIGPGFAARTAEMYLQVTNHVDEEMKNDPTFDNITESEKYYVKAPIGIATAVLESLGFRNVIAQKGLLNGFVSRALNKSTASTTAKTFGEFIKQDVKSSIGRGALTILGGGLAEFETGFFQEIAESGVKEIYNQSKGKDMFQTPDAWYEWVGDAIYAGGQEMVGGFVMGTPGAVMSAVRKQEISALPNGTFEMFEGMMSDPNYKTMYQTKLKQQINSGEITVEEAKAKEQEYDTLAGLASKIPTDYSTDQKKRALELLYKRSTLDAQIEGKDPKLVVKIQAEKDEVNRQLENILNESNNESTLDKEEEDKIPEFDQEKIELEKESKTLLDKKIEYLVSIKESLLGQGKTEEESNSIAENQWLETKEGKRYTEIQSQLQEKSKVDSKKDSDTGVTEEEKSDIDAFFDATSDNSTTKLNPNLSINRKNANISPAKKKMRDTVVKIAKISSRSISKIFPEVRIILHDSNEEYLKYATQGAGRAEFNPTQNAIHVNLSSAKRSTMPHEIFHAILINTVKTDENAAKIAEMMVNSVRKTLDSNSELAIKIDRFAGLYTGELAKFKNEEKIAELIGLLSSNEFGYRTLSKPSKNAVINFFKDVARMLGINLGPSFGKTDESVIDLINTISQKTATGEEITEEDIDILKSEPYTEGVEITVNPNAPMTPQPRQSKDIYSDISFAEKLPIVSMSDFIKRVGGKIFAITSDATKIGYDTKGDKIDGGFGYSAIKENILNKIGFASVDVKTSTGTLGKIKKRYKTGDKIGVIIMVQNPSATVGNFYGGKYLGRGLLKLKNESPESYQEAINGFVELLENKSIATEMNKKTADKKGLIDLISNPEKYNETEFAAEWIEDTTFNARRTILESLLIDNSDVKTNKSTNLLKLKLKNEGFNTIDFLMEYGDVKLLGENNIKNNIGGFAVGGFEMIVPEDAKKSAIDASNRGIAHPQFNGKLPSNGNAFIFDGLYPMQENFVEFATKETRISEENSNKADSLVRKNFKEDKFYEPEFISGEKKVLKKDRGYKHLKSAFKIKFKKSNPNLLVDINPSVVANIARGMGFSPDSKTPISEKSEFTPTIRQQKNISEMTNAQIYKEAGTSEAEIQSLKKKNSKIMEMGKMVKRKMPHPEIALQGSKDLRDGKITKEEYDAIIEENFKPFIYTKVPSPATIKEILYSLSSDKIKKGIVGFMDYDLEEGRLVASRLDIPAYLSYGVYIDTLHDPLQNNKSIAYAPTTVLNNVEFSQLVKNWAIKVSTTSDIVGKGKTSKASVAVMQGNYKREESSVTKKRAEEALNSPDWVQIGYNPYRYSYFYNKNDMKRAVVSAEEVIQVGQLVLAKGVKYDEVPVTKIDDREIRFQLSDDHSIEESGKGSFDLKKGAKKIGKIILSSLPFNKSNPNFKYVELAQIDLEERGKGLSIDLYREVAEVLSSRGQVLASRGFRNEDSERIWKSLVRDGYAQKIGENKSNGKPIYAMLPTDPFGEVASSGIETNNIYLQENETGKIQPERTRDGRGRDTSRSIETLEGAPIIQGATGPDVNLVNVAEKYAADNGIDLKRQSEYVKVDEERAKRMAVAYEEMANEPQDPKVKEAYAELIKQTKSQYEALIDAGYEFSFFDGDTDPYAGNPSNAMRDLRKNKNMAVYGTYAGYGTDGITDSEIKNNPMLADTGLRWKDNATGKKHMVTANDLFRAVHDAFGHGLEGSGFRARGEENAWQAHVRLFTGTAIAAITTETRGQNSWLNYGPYGEKNRTAKVNDTIFAEPKIGLLPSWTWNEGRAGDAVVRQQKDLNEIIADFKDNNFREEVIRDKLIRIDRFSVKKVDEALSSSMDVPVSFKNIKDGSKAGEALFKRIDNFRKLLVQKNDKSTKLKPAELKSKIIEYARKQRVTYKTTDEISETVKLFKDKLIAKNNKSKKPITTTELNKKVKAFREQEFANRDALRETAKRKIEKYEAKETDKNNKLNGILTQQEIIDKTIEFLEKQPEYIAESDTYTVGSSKKGTKTTVTKKGLSTQQAKMLSDLQKTVGIRPSQDLSSKIRMARIMIAQRKKGNMDLNAIKRELRNFIRKTLPPYLYTKTDVTKMVNLIALADSSTIDNIYNQVTEFVIQKNVKSLSEDINSILNGKYEETQSGRLKGIKIDVKTKERIKLIKNLLLSNKSTDLEILDANEKINIRLNELESEPNQTQKIITEIEDLKIIIQYNNSLLMSDTDINKVSELDEVNNALSDIIEFGKSTLAAELEAAHKEYIRQFEYVYEDIVGKAINMQDDDAEKQLKDYKADREMEAQRKKVQNRVQFLMGNISNFISTKVFSTHEALDGLMDKISSLPGEMFGGRTQEIITEKIDEATRMFKKRMMIVEMVVRAKLEDLYGKDWAKSQRENRKASFTGIYRNKQAVDKAKANYNSNPTPDNAKALENAIAKNELSISQNQMYYMYNQFKDPSNHGSFKNKYGDDYARVMKEIEEKLDPKLKEFADWQVDELFPELYEYYNDVYKRIYRTNMPWNKFYAGMLYKEGGLVEPLDLLSNNSIRNTSVGASSTKSRTENDLSIAEIDGTDALTTYLRDMEYFAAYAETIRDVNKLFTNNYIKSAIIDIHGKATMQLITDSIQKIANKGTRTGLTDWAVNSLNNVFVLSRLALSPVIMLKQLTSTFTYASDIGWANWLKYNFKNAPEMSKIWKEIRDNSVYMQDRKYDSILKAIESYTDSGMKEFVPNPTKIFVLDFMMWFTKFGDRTAIMLGGMPNYSFYKDQALKSGKTEAEAIEIAIRKFEKDTKRTQQSSDLQDKDTLQTSNPFYRASNMFMTTPRQYLRKEIQAVRALSKKVSQWDKNAGKGSVNENLRVLLMYHVYMPLLFQYVSAGLPGLLADWDEEDEKDLLRASIIGNLNALFILGEAVTMAGDLFTGKPWAGEGTKSLGILNYATSISKKAKTALKTTDPIKRAENWNKFYIEASTITGAPTPTLKKFFDNYSDLGSSGSLEKDILKAFNYSDYVISGPKKTKTTSNKIKSIYQMNAEYEKKMNSYEKQKQKDSRKIDESLIPNYRK
jgi:hypothetical protein